MVEAIVQARRLCLLLARGTPPRCLAVPHVRTSHCWVLLTLFTYFSMVTQEHGARFGGGPPIVKPVGNSARGRKASFAATLGMTGGEFQFVTELGVAAAILLTP